MDKKGIFLFVIFAFAFGISAQAALLYLDLIRYSNRTFLQTIVFALVLYIPALAAVCAAQLAPDPDYPAPRLWPIPVGHALRVTLLAPLVFLVIYALTALLGRAEAQWGMGVLLNTFNDMLRSMNQPPLTPEVAAVIPAVMLIFYPLLSILLGATLYAVAALGSVWGWHAFLYPRLRPFGRTQATLITGLLWALWFLPIVYGAFDNLGRPGDTPYFMLRFAAVAVGVTALLGEIVHRRENAGLACIALGGIFAQLQGIWDFLFQSQSVPWAGAFGVIAAAVWCSLAFAPGIFAGPAPAPASSVP